MIDCISHCLICGKESKNSAHIFGNCPIAATVWSFDEYTATILNANWRKPPFQSVKLNFDAVVKDNKNYFGISVVARDHMGYLLAAHATSLPGNLNSHYAKHYAARAAVMLARELSLQNVIFEGDSLNVIRELKENNLNLSIIDLCLLDTQMILSTFPCVELTHIRREGNEAAHSFAQFALSSSESIL
ncbi:hypothetical protein AXF42_Ash021118 [Apostasia shenzhenica]|uniref:RNase H type-1 domain-containing protein n=1 Tax=Apostasia shenzhenica TaxID=1088818 RepID=A0A2H9ZWW1_9ASPA|nr:hypothetical protein AXF42_Ash021118 [Apostasia shenzhenica]